MKYLLTSVMCVALAFTGHAQDILLKLLKEKASNLKVHIAPASDIAALPTDTAAIPGYFADSSQMRQEAVYSHQTSKGAIYLLPGDNMPCFVPDKHAVNGMPVKKPGEMQFYNMPNPYRPRQIIPDKSNRNDGSGQ